MRGRPLSDPSGSKPQAPVGVAFSEPTSDSLRVSWVQPPGGQVEDYDVQWRKAGQGPADWVDAGYDGTATEFTIEGLTGGFGTDYEVEVLARNSHGMTGWSATATGTTNRRKPGDDIVLATANSSPAGMWSDGTTLWVADAGSGAPLYRYGSDGTQMATFATAGSSGGNRDVWSDGTTVWVAPQGTANLSAGLAQGETSDCSSGGSCVLAYDMSGQRRPQRDIPTSVSPWRLWSDGATLWVGSGVSDSVTGYDLATGESVSARDLTVRVAEDGAALISVKALWSDGVSLWVGLDVFADTAAGQGSHLRVFPLDGTSTRTSAHDLVVAAGNHGYVSGVWSDRETLWVSGANFENDDGNKVLHAYVAKGAVANSPAFFGAARFATTLDVSVAENTRGYDLRAADVERGDTLTVAISGADAALFDIDAAGVVTLKNNATFDFESPTDAGANNVYELTVTVRDSKNEDGDPDSAPDQTVALTITVANIDEPGRAAITKSGALTGETSVVTIIDPDGTASNRMWQWQVLEGSLAEDDAAAAAVDDTEWSDASGTGATSDFYTPADDEAGMWLRAVGTYTDPQGPGKTAVSNIQRIFGPVAKPTDVEFKDETYNSFKVTWTASTATPRATSYDVEWRKFMSGQDAEVNWTRSIPAPRSTEYTIMVTPEPDTEYEVRVRGNNGHDDTISDWTDPVRGSTNRRKPDDDIVLHADNDIPQGMSSDGTSLWVTDLEYAVLYRHSLDGPHRGTDHVLHCWCAQWQSGSVVRRHNGVGGAKHQRWRSADQAGEQQMHRRRVVRAGL